jgi:ribosome-binding factor A
VVSRRQQKVASVIRESVSEIIVKRLSDPRIEGFISVTSVSVSPDLKQADIGLSIFAKSEESRMKTFRAIEHASSFIQHIVGDDLSLRHCPYLSFYVDSKLEERLETLDIIERLEREREESEAQFDECCNELDEGEEEGESDKEV